MAYSGEVAGRTDGEEPATGRAAAIAMRVVRRAAIKLLGVSKTGDLHERAADWSFALPRSPARARRFERIRDTGVLFVHVPKCAGMAICDALYGTQLKHATIRLYRRAAPELGHLPSFAVVRDPVERFVSAYRYAVAGGSADNRVAEPFHDRYRAFRCLDEAIDHVADAAGVFRVDHIFRPQSWYVTDAAGRVGVDRLFVVGDPALHRLIARHGGRPLARVNRSNTPRPAVSPCQIDRIRRLYAADVALYARVVADKESGGPSHRREHDRHPGVRADDKRVSGP